MKDFGGLHTWHPAVEKTDMKMGGDNKVGSGRVLSLKDGGTITETLAKYPASSRSMSCRIEESPLPATGYISTISVKPAGARKSVISWTSSFKVKEGTPDADAKKATEGTYGAGFDNLKKQLGA